ncbi:MAG: hypothetical protein FD174_2406 [Geobacteraceae bacterium]|nr:MAG: hypothetical protein FD174_2406 [Geobacteraceae bacterium]
MELDTTSFWADIKKYEDTLAKDPRSYCFAPLAEIYRKLGLLDDAIHVAKRGCEIHPEYVGGYMALGRAYFEKGMKKESRDALEKAVRVTPDNLLAHKLLSQVYMEAGETAAAENSLQTVLSLNPADPEAQMLLDSLKGASPLKFEPASASTAEPVVGAAAEAEEYIAESLADDEFILEDLEIIEELAEEEPEGNGDFVFSPVPAGETAFGAPEEVLVTARDPLKTATLAELYVSQGFIERAVGIYSELLEGAPDNAELRNRLAELKLTLDNEKAQKEAPAFSDLEISGTEPCLQPPGEGMTPPPDAEGRVLDTLEQWLENIRRRR